MKNARAIRNSNFCNAIYRLSLCTIHSCKQA